MPPVKSKIFGTTDIWERQEVIVEGGDSTYLTSKLYPISEDAGDVAPALAVDSILLKTIIINMEENAGDLGSLAVGVDYINILGPIEEDAGDLEPGMASIDSIALSQSFEEGAGDAEPAIASVDYFKESVGTAIFVDGNEEDLEPAVSITEITLNA